MSRRDLNRTPQGAWYHNYCGYPPRPIHPQPATLDGFPTDFTPRDSVKERQLYPLASRVDHEKRAFAGEHAKYYGIVPLKDAVDANKEPQRDRDMTEYERSRGLNGRSPLVTRSELQLQKPGGGMGDSSWRSDHHANGRLSPSGNEYLGMAAGGGRGGGGGWGTGDQGRQKRSEWEREWEPPVQFSPRKTTTTTHYQPSFHPRHQQQENTPSPRQIPVWEREHEREKEETERREREEREEREREREERERQQQNVYESPRQELRDDGQGYPYSYRAAPQDHTYDAGGVDPRMGQSTSLQKPTHHACGGAFLFVRFPLQRGENVHVTAKACIQAKTSDLGGRFVGIARRVFDYGHRPGGEEGCAVFQFPSLKKAELFFQYDRRFRQHDFPPPQGNAEIFAIGLQMDPNTMQSFDTFLLSEVKLNDGLGSASLREYDEHYVQPFTRLAEESHFHALPYAGFSADPKDRKSFRRHYFGNGIAVALHMFQRPDDLETLMKDKRYTCLRAIHNAMATEKCSIFTIDRQACP